MTFKDINKKFTEMVAGFMVGGYIINTSSMSGTQGEIAKIDMTDGDQIVRVLVEDFYEGSGLCGIRIIAGHCENKGGGIIWNDKLEVIREEKFYKIKGEWYGSQEEARDASDRRYERICRRAGEGWLDITSDKAIDIVLPLVREQYCLKKVARKEVSVRKNTGGGFCAYYRGQYVSIS